MKIKCLPVLALFVCFSFNSLYAQKWMNILQFPNQTVSIDTSGVKQIENQVSVLSLINYSKPQKLTSVNGKEVSTVKTQILFNTDSQKYTVIGNLYYDDMLKIIGESNIPTYAISRNDFAIPIAKNPLMTIIYNECVDFLNSGLPKIAVQNTDSLKAVAAQFLAVDSSVVDSSDILFSMKDTNTLNGNGQMNEQQRSLEKAVNNNKPKFNEIEMQNTSANGTTGNKTDSAKSGLANTANSSTTNEQPDKTIDNQNPPLITVPAEPVYDSRHETNPKSTIFTDGNLYCFQVSSWKNKPKAESEVKRLISKGHDAFMEETQIPRRGTWYRVRIGYFNSLQETEQYMRSMRK